MKPLRLFAYALLTVCALVVLGVVGWALSL
jgi:hypothetical protein